MVKEIKKLALIAGLAGLTAGLGGCCGYYVATPVTRAPVAVTPIWWGYSTYYYYGY